MVRALGERAHLGLQAAFDGQAGSVDECHLLVGHGGEQPPQRRKFQHLNVFGGQLAADPHRQGAGRLGAEHPRQQTQFAHQVQPGRHLLADSAGPHVDRVGYELTGQCQPDTGGDVGAGPVLRLRCRGAQVRRHHRLRQIEQRAVRARLGGEHVQTGAAHVTAGDRVSQCLLVDQPAAGGVDDDHAGLGLGQCLRTQQSGGLLGLGQVHRDEVGPGQYVVQWQQFDAELRGAGGRNVGVVGDDVGAECGQSRRDQLADAAQTHHAHGLAVDLGAVERRTLPGVLAQAGVGGRDLTRRRQHERDGVLGGAVDVGGGRVDHQHTGGGGGVDVDVVQADAGAGDDLQLGCGRDHLSVHRGGRAHQQGISPGHRLEQLRAVRAVDPAHLNLVPQGGDGRFGKFVGDQNNGQAHPDSVMAGAWRLIIRWTSPWWAAAPTGSPRPSCAPAPG